MSARLSFSITLVAVLLALSAQARAETILIDFGNANGAPATGGTWNVIGSPAVSSGLPLVASTGGATLVTLDIVDDLDESQAYGSGNGWPPASLPSWLDNEVLEDAFYLNSSSNATGRITFAGLDNSRSYNLEVVATRNNSSNTYIGDYQAQSSFTSNSQGFDAYQDGHLGHEIMVWTDLIPTNGEIVLDASVLTDSGTRYGMLNAMRLLAIPEPSTAALLILAMPACLLLRWRRTRRLA